MDGWYIDFLDNDGHLRSVFMGEPMTNITKFDSKIGSARAVLFMFNLYHKDEFSELVGIKRGVYNG